MAAFRVVITDFTEPDNDLEAQELSASGLSIDLERLNARAPEELADHVADADALIVQFAPITREVISRLKNCRVISRYGIGVDMIDIEAASERGIMVANVPDYCIDEVSIHALAMLLCLNRRLIEQDRLVRAAQWRLPDGPLPARLVGQVLGIIGLGNIGRAVARRALGLGMSVIAYDPFLKNESLGSLMVRPVGLEELLQVSDYVSLHCPLTEATYHLIGRKQLASMKPSAFLINMARGAVVDQAALYEALASRTIAGAGLDVLEKEPPDPDEPLLRLENVIFTPHSASTSVQSTVQLRREVARNVVIALQGGIPRSVVNAKQLGLSSGTGAP